MRRTRRWAEAQRRRLTDASINASAVIQELMVMVEESEERIAYLEKRLRKYEKPRRDIPHVSLRSVTHD